jgi:integrase
MQMDRRNDNNNNNNNSKWLLNNIRRKKLEDGKRRHEFQADHGFRKWFKTRCEISGMKPINIEKLMGHSIGISGSYYKATESELLEDYMKAIAFM